ncbi:hypothetical protein D3C72_1034860 [compost metagenome]
MQVAPQLAQFCAQLLRAGIRQCDALHVHHWLGKTSLHKHVAPIVHIGELVACSRPALLCIDGPHLCQCVRPQAGKHHKPIHRQQLVPGLQQLLRIGMVVQGHVGPEHVHAARRWLAPVQPGLAPPAHAPPGAGEVFAQRSLMPRLGLDNAQRRLWITLSHTLVRCHATVQRLPAAPGSGLLHNPRQTLLHAPPYFVMQPGAVRRRLPLPARGGYRVNRRGSRKFSHGKARYAGRAWVKCLLKGTAWQ